jgi:GGDEF domain-containing protein
MFGSRYALPVDARISAVLFDIHFERLADELGHHVALEVLKALGGYINKYVGPLGFSTRHSRDKILTVLPHINIEEAVQLVDDFAQGLQSKVLPEIHALTDSKIRPGTCFDISVAAGIAEGSSTDEIEYIIAKAEANQKIIAKYQLKKEINVQ